MPNTIKGKPVDEDKWNKAKSLADKEGHSEEYDYIMGIYKKMVGKEQFNQQYEEESKNIINLDVPLLIRLFEYFNEIKVEDADLHFIVEEIINQSLQKSYLSMEEYQTIIDANKNNKMELQKKLEQLEKQMEAIDKEKNPIEENPENLRNKGTTLDMDNIPEDKKPSNEIEDEGTKFVKTKELLSDTIKEFNDIPSMKERKVYIDDPFEAPSGVQPKQGPKGGWYYDAESGQSTQVKEDSKDNKEDKKQKDLTKPKGD